MTRARADSEEPAPNQRLIPADQSEHLSLKDCALLAHGTKPMILAAIAEGELTPRPSSPRILVDKKEFTDWLARLDVCLTMEEAVRRSGLTRRRLQKAIDEGELPARKRARPRLYSILPQDFDDWMATQQPPEKAWLSVVEAGALHGVNPGQFLRAIRRGELPGELRPRPKGGPECYLIPPAAILGWLERFPGGRRPRTGPPPGKIRKNQRALGNGRTTHSLAGTADGVSILDAAKLARCSTSHIHTCISKGILHVAGMRNGACYLDRASLEVWLESRPPEYEILAAQGELLTIKEMAKLTQLDRATVNKAITLGQLTATLVSQRGRPPFWVAFLSDFRKWFRTFNRRFESDAVLRGEPLTLAEASRTFGISLAVLQQAVKKRRIPSRRRLSAINRVAEQIVGRTDIEEWAESRRAPDKAWTCRRIAALLGVTDGAIKPYLYSGTLPFRNVSKGRRRYEVEPTDLARWMSEKMPPYRPEVVGLTLTLSQGQVTRELEIDKAQVLAALISGELRALRLLEPGGPRYVIPRASVDRWCLSQGWAQTFQRRAAPPKQVRKRALLQTGEFDEQHQRQRDRGELLSVAEAAAARECSTATIWLAIRRGLLPAQRVRNPISRRVEFAIERHHLYEWKRLQVGGKRGPKETDHKDPSADLSRGEISASTGIKKATIGAAIRRGELRAYKEFDKVAGKSIWKVSQLELSRWLKNQSKKFDFITPLDGIPLPVSQAATQFKISESYLNGKIRSGMLAAQSHPTPSGGIMRIVGSEDVRRLLGSPIDVSNEELWVAEEQARLVECP